MPEPTRIEEFGNGLAVLFDDGTRRIAYPTTGGLWLIGGIVDTPPDPGSGTVIDTISPGHTITNPGGTILSGWQWHLNNNGNRGGLDFNYNFQTFTAPADGVVDHFDVSGVGMVVRLTLTTPAVRTGPRLAPTQYDQQGPMLSIWFQHCSAAIDGPAAQGDVIGTSGNGYGAYPEHLHVHGQVNSSTSSTNAVRCHPWGFM